jgi:hypothetical protein
MPTAWLFVLGPAGLLHEAGQGRGRAPPGRECLPNGARPRDAGDSPNTVLQTPAEGATTRGLTSRHNPTPPCHAQGQTRRKRDGRFHPRTPMARTQTEAQRSAAIPTHAQAQQHRFESVTPIFALAGGRVRRLRTLRLVRLRARAGHGDGILRPLRRRDGRDLQGLACDGARDRGAMRGTPGLEEAPATVSIARGTGQPRLQQRHPPPCCQPSPHLREGMRSIQHGEPPGFDATPPREPMRRLGREEAVKYGGPLQTPYDAQDQRSVCYGLHLRYGRGP